MSTSSRSTVKRRASSFARSSTSPTSRSRRSVSAAITSSDSACASGSCHDALAHRLEMAADRRERRPQLVRDRHEEVPLELLRLRQPRRHLAEPLGEMRDLVASLQPGDGDVVATLGDLVGGARQREHGARDPARRPPGHAGRDDEPSQQRDGEELHQRQPRVAEHGLRLRDDERAERRALERDGRADRDVRTVLVGRRELERHRLARADRPPVDQAAGSRRSPAVSPGRGAGPRSRCGRPLPSRARRRRTPARCRPRRST